MNQQQALTRGVHHVGLTVASLDETRDFFIGALGFRVLGTDDAYPAVFLSDGTSVITLWQAENGAEATPFDRRRNIGLHHLALLVEDATALDAVFAAATAWPGVSVDAPPEPTRPDSAANHALIRIPGGIRVEFYAAPAN
ncbi:MAG: VOC family protein [Sphingomonas sp.]|uniref:VOC family protein n=1 Tax=Sphingomonas sp. TaxID=28214 RepID=UPI003F388156